MSLPVAQILRTIGTMTALRKVFPSRALVLLLLIGFIDLFTTAILHAKGLIVELNPLMRPLIERSEWTFVLVKSLSLLLAWGVMAWYANQNRAFVRKVCLAGSAAYVTIWLVWFLSSL